MEQTQEYIVVVLTETGQTYKWKSTDSAEDLESRLLVREKKFDRFMGIDDSGQPVRHNIWLENVCFVAVGAVSLVATGPTRPSLM